MNCQYCGNEFWASRVIGDSDFCSLSHRSRFHNQLRAALQRIGRATDIRSTGLAPYHSGLAVDSESRATEFDVVSYKRPIRIPAFALTATDDVLAPELADSGEPEQLKEATRSELPPAHPASSDERPLRISAILAKLRHELADRRDTRLPSAPARRTDRVIELPLAV